jgi:hypothetical protein
LVNPSGWEKVESVEIVCPRCFHTFEIRRDSVEALLVATRTRILPTLAYKQFKG